MKTPSIMRMDWKSLGYQAKYEIVDNQVTVIWEQITKSESLDS
jgi:hypothetical protein